jgi:hypothetical protein
MLPIRYNLLILSLSIIVIGLISCSKGGGPTAPPLSSEKKLNAVVFKVADNTGLPEDITGAISGDTLKAKFPAGVSLNGLVPTIDFAGSSISPANRTLQNFTSPVTYRITAQDGSVKTFTFYCDFINRADSIAIITTRWSVQKDSVTNVGNFYYPDLSSPIPGVYIGNANDYYDFNINGVVYYRENNNTGNVSYQVLANGRISFALPYTYECAIQYLSSTKMTLFWSMTSPNGGQYTRTLYLKR